MIVQNAILGGLASCVKGASPQDEDGNLIVHPVTFSSWPYRTAIQFTPSPTVIVEVSAMNNGGLASKVGAGSSSAQILSVAKGIWELWLQASGWADVASPGNTTMELIVTDESNNALAILCVAALTQNNVSKEISFGPMICAFNQNVRFHVAVFSAVGSTVTALGSGYVARLM